LIYGTTETFLEHFGLTGLGALPRLEEIEDLMSSESILEQLETEADRRLGRLGQEQAATAGDNGGGGNQDTSGAVDMEAGTESPAEGPEKEADPVGDTLPEGWDVRLNRYLALAGLGARRKVESLIREGRIEVNGQPVETLAVTVEPDRDRVTFDGQKIRIPKTFLYVAMNKPSGIVVSAQDERGRTTVYDLLPQTMRDKVRAVGRLDRASEGLLLFTNDGELAHSLLHPSQYVKKTYLAWVRPRPKSEEIRALREGVPLGRGERSGRARVKLLGARGSTARVRLVLTEGKNREIRRMFRAIGCHVLALRRIGIDGIELGVLRSGGNRRLTRPEIASLRQATGRRMDEGVRRW
jgi:23S rRNA pseudouridine2605 synthase